MFCSNWYCLLCHTRDSISFLFFSQLDNTENTWRRKGADSPGSIYRQNINFVWMAHLSCVWGLVYLGASSLLAKKKLQEDKQKKREGGKIDLDNHASLSFLISRRFKKTSPSFRHAENSHAFFWLGRLSPIRVFHQGNRDSNDWVITWWARSLNQKCGWIQTQVSDQRWGYQSSMVTMHHIISPWTVFAKGERKERPHQLSFMADLRTIREWSEIVITTVVIIIIIKEVKEQVRWRFQLNSNCSNRQEKSIQGVSQRNYKALDEIK